MFDRALDALIGRLEKRKFAASTRPRRSLQRVSANPRHIPAQVKRAVWERDGGRCTFVGAGGRRCGARKMLEYDHIEPVARGGGATLANVRLRCRGHNQHEAERAFGAGFMSAKREAARRARAFAEGDRVAVEDGQSRETGETRARAAAEAKAKAQAAEAQTRDLLSCLSTLGFRAADARRAAESCRALPEAGLEERVRAALKFLCPRHRVSVPSGTTLGGSLAHAGAGAT